MCGRLKICKSRDADEFFGAATSSATHVHTAARTSKEVLELSFRLPQWKFLATVLNNERFLLVSRYPSSHDPFRLERSDTRLTLHAAIVEIARQNVMEDDQRVLLAEDVG